MDGEERYPAGRWTIQGLSDRSILVLGEPAVAYALGTTADSFIVKALAGGQVEEEAAVCLAPASRTLHVSVTAGGSTTRLRASFDGACVSLRYFRDNVLVLDDEAAVLSGYSAPALAVATDRTVHEQAVHLRRLVDRLQSDTFFRQQVSHAIGQFAAASSFGPVDFCDWVCKQCWNGMYLPHSCLACIYCNSFTTEGPAGDD